MGNAAKTVLPIAATALGGYFLGPVIATELGVSAAAGTAIGSAAGGLAGSAISGSQQPNDVAAPPVSEVPTMPTPDGSAVEVAKQKSIAAQISRRGRASTILTQGGLDAGNKLGS